jgi:thymidylate synthase
MRYIFFSGHGTTIQFFVSKEYLSMQMYQRSADACLGLPYNIASYGLFLIMMAHCSGKTPGRLRIIIGDGHVYDEHVAVAKEQISRTPFPFPVLKIKQGFQYNDPSEFKISDFVLADYKHHGKLEYAMKA